MFMFNKKMLNSSELSYLLEKELNNLEFNNKIEELGIVINVSDGVILAYGLDNVYCGELVTFSGKNMHGLVLNLEEYYVGIIVLGDFSQIKEGDKVIRTNKFLSVKVSYSILGRVMNALGEFIDKNDNTVELYDKNSFFEMPVERKAPEVIFREPVNQPLQTGIKIIDSMIPIGRGQRELIIGDRQTGKTSIAIDTILNQRYLYEAGKPIYCIYVSIGQKLSSLARILDILKRFKALDYTLIVSASASESAAMQFIAPFTATAIGEFFRDTGKSALIIYDDLSKHAVAYREISLLLKRPPGREAFPGDVFYLHSRLLERSAKIISDDNIVTSMNDLPVSLKHQVKGGGSLTSFPIVETQSGDISSYIPTNIISITDGQIFLETSLFNSGIKPAINESLSVSRIGGEAQVDSMRKVANKLKINQSQYKDLESFSKFSSDLDNQTLDVINRGKINIELLKQDLHSTYSLGLQIAIIFIANKNILSNLCIDKIKIFEYKFVNILNKEYSNILNKLSNGFFNDDIAIVLEDVANTVVNYL